MPLSAVQTQALALLVAGKKIVDVAASLKICDRTLRRWKQDPEFAKELADEIESAEGYAALQNAEAEKVKAEASHESMKFLRSVMNNKDNDAAFRLRAAMYIQQVSLQSAKAADARKWRAFVYHDRKNESAQKKTPAAVANPESIKPAAAPIEKADKTGHSPMTQPPSAAQTDTPPVRNPGVPPGQFKTEDQGLRTEPQADEIPDKTGHPSSNPGVPPGQSTAEAIPADTTAAQKKPDDPEPSATPKKKWPPRPNKVPFYANVC
jgi:hypothetical protein